MKLIMHLTGAAPFKNWGASRSNRTWERAPDGDALAALPRDRPTRQAIRIEECDSELVAALGAVDLSHLDPELDKLLN